MPLYLAVCWYLVKTACSSLKLCRNEFLRAGGMMILELLRSKQLSEVSSFLTSQTFWANLGACLHVAGHPFCESLDCGQHQVAAGLLTYLGQSDVTEGCMVHTHRSRGISSLSDTGEPGQGIWKSHFTTGPASKCGIILL